MNLNNVKLQLLLVSTVMTIVACGREEPEPQPPATPVTVAMVQAQWVEETTRTIGRLEADTAPSLSAQTSGRVVEVLVEAGDAVVVGQVLARLDGDQQRASFEATRGEVLQLEALSSNQAKRVERLEALVEAQLISADQFEEAQAQSKALRSQLDSARARLTQAQLNLQYTEMTSPVAGEVQARLISAGDFVTVGQVAFDIIAAEALQAVFPVPQQLGAVVSVGQSVRLHPVGMHSSLTLPITEVRPAVGARSRAVEVVVDVTNPGDWRAGGSMVGQIILASRDGVVVPPNAVVRRPSGDVVYVVDEASDVVAQRLVELGVRGPDWVEVRSGLDAGEMIVVDGAGFLTDGARVSFSVEATEDEIAP